MELLCGECCCRGRHRFFPVRGRIPRCYEVSSIVVVSPLVSVMRYQVKQLKQLRLSAAATGLGEEYDEEDKHHRRVSEVTEEP